MRKFAAIVSLCFCSLTGGLSSGLAHAGTDIDWGVSISSGMPPPPVYPYGVQGYGAPSYRPQPVWVADSWYWNGAVYVLIPGHWEQPRTNYGYAQPGWTGSRSYFERNYDHGEYRGEHRHDRGRHGRSR